ncbi:MAG: DNA alkylation repair protein [Nocardioides sp.]|uniref:DNA alkylation repair protein n=1 Tax=Nocardioides sp. TaxID=35761 RepID=UPI0039E58070
MSVVAEIRATLAAHGDPERALAQQAYMKSALPYRGIAKPELTRLLRPMLRGYAPDGRAAWERDVRELWDGVAFREEWYAVIALLRHPRVRPWLDADALPLLRHLLATGAWWDVVDEVATHPLRIALADHPADVTPTVRAWASDEDPWVRRASVICQVGRRGEADLDLLAHAVEANLDDTSFWLRKAIGWALRDQARTDPAWVRDHVDRWGSRLSGLSRREALKHL